jgi:AraC-like DNA-binding protein
VSEEVDEVTAWRAAGADRAIWMRGRTTGYAVDPVGEYVIGVATGAGYRLRRGRVEHPVPAGRLVVLDPAAAHRGRPLGRDPWSARLLVLELADVDDERLADRAVVHPIVDDQRLARRFVDLHRTSLRAVPALEMQAALTAFLDDLLGTPSAGHPDRSVVAQVATRLHDDVTRNVSLDELAATVGCSKFHLVRQFRTVTGVPPHTYQIGLRVRLARRLLERGVPVAETAVRSGFTDQSHLHRHFRARLGITPGRYAHAFGQQGG